MLMDCRECELSLKDGATNLFTYASYEEQEKEVEGSFQVVVQVK